MPFWVNLELLLWMQFCYRYSLVLLPWIMLRYQQLYSPLLFYNLQMSTQWKKTNILEIILTSWATWKVEVLKREYCRYFWNFISSNLKLICHPSFLDMTTILRWVCILTTVLIACILSLHIHILTNHIYHLRFQTLSELHLWYDMHYYVTYFFPVNNMSWGLAILVHVGILHFL